jgi:hypothetical protein
VDLVQRVLVQLLVPMTQDLVRKIATTAPHVPQREFPQVSSKQYHQRAK